jgi:hypothetical protein
MEPPATQGREISVPRSEEERAARFAAQLAEDNAPETVTAVRSLLDGWAALGGRLEYGTARTVTSCFLMLDRGERGPVWPVNLYPAGKGTVEVQFQHLAVRAPFDDVALREVLRERLNGLDGVEIPADRLERRPSFPLAALADEANRDRFAAVLTWFWKTAS